MKRVLITGSREWINTDAIHAALGRMIEKWGKDFIVVHGTARGADTIAGNYALLNGLQVEEHPADWKQYGKAAGHIRNKEMVEAGADVCLAFILNESPGATNGALLATEAGIPTLIVRETDEYGV